MIYITSGHELGIGLEIFFNAMMCFGDKQRSQFTLISDSHTLKNYLNKTSVTFNFIDTGKIKNNPTLDSLNYALDIIKGDDILITLPSSKDQFFYNGKNHLGYTEFLRHRYKKNFPMTFYSNSWHIGLLTDHLPLKEVFHTLKDIHPLYEKMSLSIDGIQKYFYQLDQVIFSGINPHAGENGLLGDEEKIFLELIDNLKIKYPHINFLGPKPSDTIHLFKNAKKFHKKQFFVYAFHDQGLNPFKLVSGVRGINITHGLPFLRMSVDHGTAFDLFGKNEANFMGLYYVLEKALTISLKGIL